MDELVIDIKTEVDQDAAESEICGTPATGVEQQAMTSSLQPGTGGGTDRHDNAVARAGTAVVSSHDASQAENPADGGQRGSTRGPRRARGSTAMQLGDIGGTVEKLIINGFEVEINVIMDTHGWITIEGAKMPYLVRASQKFLPLCVIEKTLLAPYPGPYLESELGRAPMMGFYLKTEEVRLLNRFVMHTFTHKTGIGRFSLKDMLVTLPDFIDFYQKVRSVTHIAPRVISSPETAPQPDIKGGWAQVNNTIVPYVLRNRVKMVPLSVVQYAAGLLSEVEVPSLSANSDECKYLNSACSEVGMEFEFQEDTRLLELFLVPTLSKSRVSINELPKKDPLAHARFLNRSSNDRRSVFVAASVRQQEIAKVFGKPVGAAGKKSSEGQEKTDQKSPGKSPPRQKSPPTSSIQSPPPLKRQMAPGPPPAAPPRLQLIRAPVSTTVSTTASPQPSPVSPPSQGPPSSPNVVQLPIGQVKFCPQHGIRRMVLPTPGTGQNPTPMVIQPPQLQARAPAVQPSAPVMVIRLDNPVPPNAQIIVNGSIANQPQVIRLNGPLPSNAQIIRLNGPLPANGQPLLIPANPGAIGGGAPVLIPHPINNPNVPVNNGIQVPGANPPVIKIESEDEDDICMDTTEKTNAGQLDTTVCDVQLPIKSEPKSVHDECIDPTTSRSEHHEDTTRTPDPDPVPAQSENDSTSLLEPTVPEDPEHKDSPVESHSEPPNTTEEPPIQINGSAPDDITDKEDTQMKEDVKKTDPDDKVPNTRSKRTPVKRALRKDTKIVSEEIENLPRKRPRRSVRKY